MAVPFYSMRFIRGNSLQDAIEKFHRTPATDRNRSDRTLELRQLLGRFLAVCNAIAYTHSRGILHRDLKPGNIMLGNFGETLVVDWGLAKSLDRPELAAASEGLLRPLSSGETARTQLGAVIGTPAFMSPEQAAGEIDRLGPASDVYSLGATLYCLLTSRAPFTDNKLETLLRKVQCGDFPRPRQLVPWVPPSLEAVCLRAMALRPERRYDPPRTLADDLEHWLADEPVKAYEESWIVRSARWPRRHRTGVIASLVALVVTLAALGTATVFLTAANDRERTSRAQAQKKEKEADQQRIEANEQRNVAGRRAAELLLDHGLQLCEQRDVRQGMLWLAWSLQQALAVQASELETAIRRNLHAWQRYMTPVQGFLAHPAGVRSTAFEPRQGFLATGCDDGKVRLWEPTSRKLRGEPLQHTSAVLSLAFSPDGTTLLTGTQAGTAHLWDVATGQQRTEPLRQQKSIVAVAFSPQGKSVATASADGTARLWQADTGKPIGESLTHEEEVWSLAFSPDGRTLLTGSRDRRARLWEAASGKSLGAELYDHDLETAGFFLWYPGQTVAFHPGGKIVVTAGMRSARLWDVATRKPLEPRLSHLDAITAVAFSPNGHILATASTDKTARLWESATGRPIGHPLPHDGGVCVLAFSADSRTLVTGTDDGAVLYWDAITGQLRGTPPAHHAITGRRAMKALRFSTTKIPVFLNIEGHTDGVQSLSIHPDGSIASSGADRLALLWQLPRGQV